MLISSTMSNLNQSDIKFIIRIVADRKDY